MGRMTKKTTQVVINEITHQVESDYDKGKLVYQEWRVNGNLHREDNLPAVINNELKESKWYFNGLLHRENGAAIINKKENFFYLLGNPILTEKILSYSFSKKEKLINNEIYLVYEDNFDNKYYLKNNKLHSIDNETPSLIIQNFEKHWHKNGLLHRDNDLPAIIVSDFEKHWLVNGKYHRDVFKPAFISVDDGIEYWFEGKNYSEQDLQAIFIKQKINNF